MNRTEIENLLKDFNPFQQITQTAGLEELTSRYLDSTSNVPEIKQDIKIHS